MGSSLLLRKPKRREQRDSNQNALAVETKGDVTMEKVFYRIIGTRFDALQHGKLCSACRLKLEKHNVKIGCNVSRCAVK